MTSTPGRNPVHRGTEDIAKNFHHQSGGEIRHLLIEEHDIAVRRNKLDLIVALQVEVKSILIIYLIKG